MRRSRTSIFRRTVSSTPDLSAHIFRHQRLVIAGGIALLAALGWWFLLSGAGMAMPGMTTPPFVAVLVMWWLMMAAMMLPSAAPAILLYARVRHMRGGDAIPHSSVFLAGYLLLWLLFSLVAAAAQHFLADSVMVVQSRAAQAALLIAAGVYQLSPLKTAYLGECRSPAQFISRHWRPGWTGTLRLGLLHGAYCVGCCWALMLLLFVGGVMNLLWVVAIAALVAAEKLVPHGLWLGRIAGIALLAWGAALLLF